MKLERWDTAEFAYQAERSYSNPFRDVALVATFVHESSGRAITARGFYDGGSNWRIRFMATELGTWRYVTRSNDPGLDGKAASLTCVPPTQPYLHGPLLCKGHHFAHADGTPRFVISTRLSCQFAAPEVRARVVRFLHEHRINRVFFMMAGVKGDLKCLWGEGPDFDRYNLEKWQAIDAFVDELRRAGILASPYFYYFNDGVMRFLTPEQDRAYLRYGMARFGAYANVLPVLSNEVEQKCTVREDGVFRPYDLSGEQWVDDMGRYLCELSVFGAPVTVHNPMENFVGTRPSYHTRLRDWQYSWADYMLRQAQVGSLGAVSELSDDLPEVRVSAYTERAFARHNQLLIELRRFGVPMINEEPGYEMAGAGYDDGVVERLSWNNQSARRLLRTFWTAVTAGGYIAWGSPATYNMVDPMWGLLDSVMPQRLRLWHDFMVRLPYWEMEPANEAVSANAVEIEGVGYRTNFCLAKPGERYLVFSLHGGECSLTFQPGVRYQLTDLDPRTGHETDLGEVDGGTQAITLPIREQVLLATARR